MRKIIPVLTAALFIALATGPASPKGSPTVRAILERLAALEDLHTSVVFVTSTRETGDLKSAGGGADGLEGADNICQARADAGTAVPEGTYKAWLSTSTVDAKDRVAQSTERVIYKLVDGTTIATGIEDLTDGTIGTAISLNENDGVVLFNVGVWTGTTGAGVAAGNDCNGWTDTSGDGVRGSATLAGSGWTVIEAGGIVCTQRFRLYCFQEVGGD